MKKITLDSALSDGIMLKERMLWSNGGTVTISGAAELSGRTRGSVERQRENGSILGVRHGRIFHFPVWQFDLPGTADVLRVLKNNGHDEWSRLLFFANPQDSLDGKTPIECLRAGELDRVMRAANVFMEQGA
jgi:hypothetical protein